MEMAVTMVEARRRKQAQLSGSTSNSGISFSAEQLKKQEAAV